MPETIRNAGERGRTLSLRPVSCTCLCQIRCENLRIPFSNKTKYQCRYPKTEGVKLPDECFKHYANHPRRLNHEKKVHGRSYEGRAEIPEHWTDEVKELTKWKKVLRSQDKVLEREEDVEDGEGVEVPRGAELPERPVLNDHAVLERDVDFEVPVDHAKGPAVRACFLWVFD